MQTLDEITQQDINEFNTVIDAKATRLEEAMKAGEEEMIARHSQEVNDLIASMEEKLSRHVIYSKEYYELKNSEAALVKQQRFKEAEIVQKKAEKLGNLNLEKWNKIRNDKIRAQITKLTTMQNNEKNTFRAKYDTEFDMLNKERQMGLNSINHKFKNRKQELLLQHKQEWIMFDNFKLHKASMM
jgi:hypothetical protein